VGDGFGVLIAIVSSCLGGTAAAVTRYLSGNADPLTLAILRRGIGIVCVLPIALIMRVRWPRRYDVLGRLPTPRSLVTPMAPQGQVS